MISLTYYEHRTRGKREERRGREREGEGGRGRERKGRGGKEGGLDMMFKQKQKHIMLIIVSN